MANSMTPTIGRKVWLWLNPAQAPEGTLLDVKQAFDATVIFVHPSGKINVRFTTHDGQLGGSLNVRLQQPDGSDVHSSELLEPYCTWMPYQVTQAQKTFSETKREEADK